MSTANVLVAVYDEGAASPAEIALGFEGHARLVFAVGSSIHARSMMPVLQQLAPTFQADDLDVACAEISMLCPAGIVTFSERAIPLAYEIAARLNLPFHEPGVTRCLIDKVEQRSALRSRGAETMRFAQVRSNSDWDHAKASVGFPLVIKPAQSGASRNTFVVHSSDEGDEVMAMLLDMPSPGFVDGGALIVEEFIRGRDCLPFADYVSVETIVQKGVARHVAVTGKFPMVEPFRETGRFWPAPISNEEQQLLFDMTTSVLQALEVDTGIMHTEFKLTERRPRLLEVNGRLGGGINELSRRAGGPEFVSVAADLALGVPVSVGPIPAGPVYFQIFHPAPRKACQLVAVEGVEEVLKLPGVTYYRPYFRAGAKLPGGVHTQELDMILGTVPSLGDLASTAERIRNTIRFRFKFEDKEVLVSGNEIGVL